MYLNFDEIIDNMITPESNADEFIKLLLTSEKDSNKLKLMLTSNFNYNLNPNGGEDLFFYIENVRFKANIFLQSIEKMSPEEFQKHKTDITNEHFISFMKFLSTISKDDFWKLVNIRLGKNIENSSKIKEFIGYYEKFLGDKDGFDFIPTTGAWYYFRSYTMSPGIKESFHTDDIKHRLYITINYDQLMSFTTDFINELENIGLPYYLKIKSCLGSGRCRENDSLVIYVDSEERVVQYVNILNDLINKNENYKKAIHTPSAHLGIISNLIGYGREFERDTSYSGIIGEAGYSAINYALQEVRFELFGFKSDATPKMLKQVMLNVIEDTRYSLSSKATYENFKKIFWEKFYELLNSKGYSTEDSICFGERESQLMIESDKNRS